MAARSLLPRKGGSIAARQIGTHILHSPAAPAFPAVNLGICCLVQDSESEAAAPSVIADLSWIAFLLASLPNQLPLMSPDIIDIQ